jgi:hypothetical protein
MWHTEAMETQTSGTMIETFSTSTGDVTIMFEDDGFITEATDWSAIVTASDYPTTTIVCCTTYDGHGTYGLEYYYTGGVR